MFSQYLLWAEAKAGCKEDIVASFVQLVLTIGKSRAHENYLPPNWLAAFDEEKMAFVEFSHIYDVLYQNDFNWNVTPSNHKSKEFLLLYKLMQPKIEDGITCFYFDKDKKELQKFIRDNIRLGQENKIATAVTRNNFMFVFRRWVEEVKPTIAFNWNEVPNTRVVDFFYADLISRNDYTCRETLQVLLRRDYYKVLFGTTEGGTDLFGESRFNDGMKAYRQFWNRYTRPPRKEYLDIILTRRDLLVPQDMRRYQGAFFTPERWVQKSQEYLAKELGEDWQDNYEIWDCCAGTGNLLYGLTNKYHLWATTLDNADVQVMKERIRENNLQLLESHVAQFDFLNDGFEKLPQGLQNIIYNPERRKTLVIFINPPYAEASDKDTLKGGKAKNAVEQTATNKKYAKLLGQGNAEIFAQFFIRIYNELQGSILAEFSKLKILQGPHFDKFRLNFQARLGGFFCVPAKTFDNVSGEFPIGFMIWHTGERQKFTSAKADIFDAKGVKICEKTICAYDNGRFMNEWIKPYRAKKNDKTVIGKFPFKGNDFQNQRIVQIVHPNMDYNTAAGQFLINKKNLEIACVYFAVRKIIPATWLNDRDQFLYPTSGWKEDVLFRSDCLVYTLFNNNIQSEYGTNHWIPFTEIEVNAKDNFESHFMSDYIAKGINEGDTEYQQDFFRNENSNSGPIVFSTEAKAVMDAGRELWRYYHSFDNVNLNASFYDIRLYFQGTKINSKGKIQMNSTSEDNKYTQLLSELRNRVRTLAAKIEPKIYEYKFLVK